MAHQNLDMLLDYQLQFAKNQLQKYSSFYPYAALMKEDEKMEALRIYEGDEHPKPLELIEKFNSLLRSSAKLETSIACSLCKDVKISKNGIDKKDAIQVDLEHRNGESLSVFLPYAIQNDKSVIYGNVFSQIKEKEWFD